MIVTCPNCTTRLQLDAAKLPSRPFSVRCPKCQQIINAQPPAAVGQRDALAVGGDVPASARSTQEMSAAPQPSPPPVPTTLPREEAATSASGAEDVLRLLASLLRREAVGETAGAGGRGWEHRRALVCAGSGFSGDAARALGESGYFVSVASHTAQAVELMREEHVDVVVLDPEFDVREQGASQVSRQLASMRTAERRRVVFVLLSNSARTGDAHAAFLAGANLVVHAREAAQLPRVLEKNIRDLNELYRDFNKALGLAEL